jgi:peptide/nickel transport system substrate-binding protein
MMQIAGAGAATSVLAGSGWSAAAQDATPAGANPFGEPTTTGGTYSIAGIGSGLPRNFVPTSYYSTSGFYHSKLIYTPLVMLDPDWKEFGPGLATSWEWSDDGLSLTMPLRQGVTFHDGEPFTAEDVVFTYKLMARTDSAPAITDLSLVQGAIEYQDGTSEEFPGVEALDDHTVRFNLTSPSNIILRSISNCGILPSHMFSPDDLAVGGVIEDVPFFSFANGTPVGTGPWKIAEYDPETHLHIDANSSTACTLARSTTTSRPSMKPVSTTCCSISR